MTAWTALRRIALASAPIFGISGCDRHAPAPEAAPAAASAAEGVPGALSIAEVETPRKPVRGESDDAAAECATSKAKVRLARPETARRAGIEAVTATSRPLFYSVRATGVVAFDERRLARLSSRVPAVLREAAKLPGDDVEEGAVLAVLESMELGEAKAQLRQAAALADLREKTWAIERELVQGRISSRREALTAEAALAEAKIDRDRARQKLRLLGLDAPALERVERGEDTDATLSVRAPFSGTVVERNAAVGEAVEPGHALFVVADLSRLLVQLDLVEKDYPLVDAGARVLFTPDGLPGEVFRGKLISRGATLDATSRTVRALAEVKNVPRAGGERGVSPREKRTLLLPGMFGRAEIVVRDAEETLVVPREAVQWEGCHYVVFVEVREGFYQTKPVELGIAAGAFQEVRSGLAPGDRVVSTGSYLLKTEILKGSIGAGCCD